jgi:hypothetical protein
MAVKIGLCGVAFAHVFRDKRLGEHQGCRSLPPSAATANQRRRSLRSLVWAVLNWTRLSRS